MLRKISLILLGLGVLAATGVASLPSCCGMESLARPDSAEMHVCCDRADCCRVEKRGPAPAALSLTPPEPLRGFAPGLCAAPWLAGAAALPRADLAGLLLFEKDHPPPLDGRGTHLRISVFRV